MCPGRVRGWTLGSFPTSFSKTLQIRFSCCCVKSRGRPPAVRSSHPSQSGSTLHFCKTLLMACKHGRLPSFFLHFLSLSSRFIPVSLIPTMRPLAKGFRRTNDFFSIFETSKSKGPTNGYETLLNYSKVSKTAKVIRCIPWYMSRFSLCFHLYLNAPSPFSTYLPSQYLTRDASSRFCPPLAPSINVGANVRIRVFPKSLITTEATLNCGERGGARNL